MIKDVRRALEKRGYTADEIEVLLKSFTELLGKLRTQALWKLLAYRCTIHRRLHRRGKRERRA
jgi:hypothetical protein